MSKSQYNRLINERRRELGIGTKRKSKYNNKRTTIDGITFDSKQEAEYYVELQLRKASGEIKDFDRQVKYILQEGFTKNGVKYAPITYKADFVVYYHDGSKDIIDVKGKITKEFAIKQKMFEYKFEESLKLIVYDKKYGFIDKSLLEKIEKGKTK